MVSLMLIPGCGDDRGSNPPEPPGNRVTVTIADHDYISGKYFFLLDPDSCLWQLDPSKLGVFIDDQDAVNDDVDGAIPALATIDGEPTPDSTTYRGMFRRLHAGDTPEREYRIETQMYTGNPVLVLDRRLEERDVLAVLGAGWELDANQQRGAYFTVGQATLTDSLRLKVVRPSRSDRRVDITDLRRGPWAPLRSLELKNIYDLGARGILEDRFECRIRLWKRIAGVYPDRIGDITFLQMTGLDLSRETRSGLVPGRDGRIDPQFINLADGILRFPDLRPFDPSPIDLGMQPVSCLRAPFYRFLPWKEGDDIREARPAALPGVADQDSSATYRAPAIYDRVVHRDAVADSRYFLEILYERP
jgi:hypothetical protein